jgi:type IV pilus assembly protein PilM
MMGRVLGLDWGSYAVKAVELRQTLRSIEVARLHSLPLGPEPSLAPREFLLRHGLATERVIASVPGDRITRRLLRFPFKDRRKIAQATRFEVEGEIPFPLEDVFVDWEIVSEGEAQTEVAATVAPRSEVAARLETLAEVGIVPRILEAEGLVLGNLTGLVDLPGTRLLLDFGHRKTTLCLLVDGRAHLARTLPVGGGAITSAIAQERQLSLADAEQLKRNQGIFERGFETRLPAAVGVLERLVRELTRTLASFEPMLNGVARTGIETITLIGGSARLHRLDEFLSDRLGLPTTRIQVPPGSPAAGVLAAGDLTQFAPALALALRGTLRARSRMNFLQEEFAPRLDLRRVGRETRWTSILAGSALVLAMVWVATAITLDSRRAERLKAQTERLWSEAFPDVAVPENVPASLREALRDAEQRAEFLGVYRGNLSALDLLTEISANVPAGLAVVFEELSIDGRVIRIRGHAPSFEAVDQLRAALSNPTPFSEIRVSEIQSDAARGGNTFSVTISLATPEENR